VNSLTKYVHLYPFKFTDVKSLVHIMTKFIETRGRPDRIISDLGSCFTSRPFEQFCEVHNIEHILNSTKYPQTNGQVERANRTIGTLLSMSISYQRSWDSKVNEVERMLNTAENKTTKKTPFPALRGANIH